MNPEKRALGCRVTDCSSLPKTVLVLGLSCLWEVPHPMNISALDKQDSWDVQSLMLDITLGHQKMNSSAASHVNAHPLRHHIQKKNWFLHLPLPQCMALAQTQAKVNKLNYLEPVLKTFDHLLRFLAWKHFLS